MGFSLEDYAEPSVRTWFLMSSPFPILIIIACYLWFCLKAGPHFMRKRKPFKLKGFIKFYNLFQVVLNAYIALRIIWQLVPYVNYRCEPVPDSNTPIGRLMIFGTYAVFLVKLSELTDTPMPKFAFGYLSYASLVCGGPYMLHVKPFSMQIVFVLRKKYNQISTLHLYHHSMVAFMGWMCSKYFPGGNVWFFGLLNISVHAIMYSYYFIAALGPNFRQYLWWKKYITILQMVQFVLVFTHSVQGLFADCNYPKGAMVLTGAQSVIFFTMFAQFYINTYIKPRKQDTIVTNFK